MAYGSNTSKLEAVNQMLSTIGQSRINTLASAGEANDAQKILEEIDKAVQTEGWHFNRFNDVPLVKGTGSIGHTNSGTSITTGTPHYLVKDENVINNGVALTVASITSNTVAVLSAAPATTTTFYADRIEVPTDVLNIDLSIYQYAGIDPVARGKFLFDRRESSYKFSDDVKAVVTYQLPFETTTDTGEPAIPEYARRYIVTKAARVFAARHVGDPQLVKMAAQEEYEARMNLIHKETENGDYSMFNSRLSNYTVVRDSSTSYPYAVIA
jgi:hypothetical protein